MEVQLRLRLPTESRFVPLLRTTTSRFLVDLGVSPADIDDVQLILTEACANVVRHAADTSEYRVDVGVGADSCVIVVTDDGPGFDTDDVRASRTSAEHGRGLTLMGALADKVTFTESATGHAVRLEKRWADSINPTGASPRVDDDRTV